MQCWSSERISLDPTICHGKAVVKGTRILVANVVSAIAAKQSISHILEDYPSLKEDDVRACLEFAARLTAFENI